MGLIVHRIRQFTRQQPTILFALAVLALLVRAGVPAGWMPSFAGGAVAISVCSGEGRATMWLDKSGQIHKSDPAQSDLGESECAFAAGAGAVDRNSTGAAWSRAESGHPAGAARLGRLY